VAVLVVWSVAIVALAIGDDSGFVYAVAGGVLTIGVGALIDSLWVLLAPLVLATALLVPLAATDDEGFGLYDDTWGVVIFVALVYFVAPATVALGAGIAARRMLWRD
jgi:hypothetical protein